MEEPILLAPPTSRRKGSVAVSAANSSGPSESGASFIRTDEDFEQEYQNTGGQDGTESVAASVRDPNREPPQPPMLNNLMARLKQEED
jgi:hypothetical protein